MAHYSIDLSMIRILHKLDVSTIELKDLVSLQGISGVQERSRVRRHSPKPWRV